MAMLTDRPGDYREYSYSCDFCGNRIYHIDEAERSDKGLLHKACKPDYDAARTVQTQAPPAEKPAPDVRRDAFAACAMQGILAAGKNLADSPSKIAGLACDYADALIRKLKQNEP